MKYQLIFEKDSNQVSLDIPENLVKRANFTAISTKSGYVMRMGNAFVGVDIPVSKENYDKLKAMGL